MFVLVLISAFFAMFPALAHAGRLEEQPVSERIQPGYEVQPKHIGGLELFPSARVMALFNDNIYAASNGVKSDLVTTINPALAIRTPNQHHGFKAKATSTHGLYQNYNGENYNDYHLDFEPYWHMTPALQMNAVIALDQNHDARTAEAASNNIGAEEPVRWQRSIGRLGWDYKPGRVGMTLFTQTEQRRYENVATLAGSPLVNDDRDRNENSLHADLNYDLSGKTTLYLHSSKFIRDYKRRDFLVTAYNGVNRDSDGYQSVLGISTNITPLIKIDVNGGVYSQSFDDSALRNIQNFIGQSDITWQMTPLTTLDLGIKRAVYETIQPNAAGYIQNQSQFSINHELKRNIILGAQATVGNNNYVGSNRKDRYQGAGPFLIYKMNRIISWKADLLFDQRNSNQAFADYNRQQACITMQVQF